MSLHYPRFYKTTCPVCGGQVIKKVSMGEDGIPRWTTFAHYCRPVSYMGGGVHDP